MNRRNLNIPAAGFSLTEMLVALAISGAAALFALGLIQNQTTQAKKTEADLALAHLRSEVTRLLSDHDNCKFNLGGSIAFSATNPKLEDISVFLPKLSLYDSGGSEKFVVVSADNQPISSIEVGNLRPLKADFSEISADLVLRSRTTTPATQPLVYPNIVLSFKNDAGEMKLSSCQPPSNTPTYNGLTLQTLPIFSHVWTNIASNQKVSILKTYKLSDFSDPTRVQVNATCTVKSHDAGTGVDMIFRKGAQEILSLNVCFLWGIDGGNVATFKAGQFLPVPLGTTDLDIKLKAARGDDGNYWAADAQVNFFK